MASTASDETSRRTLRRHVTGHGRVDLEGSVDSGEVEHASDRPVARHTDDAEVAVDAVVVALGR
jgi:hypothetical protein